MVWIKSIARGAAAGAAAFLALSAGGRAHWRSRTRMLVPMRGEAAWLTAQGRRPYSCGEGTALRYEYCDEHGCEHLGGPARTVSRSPCQGRPPR